MNSIFAIYYVSFFIGGLLIALIVNILLLKFSKTLGIRNKNDVVIRWSNQSKPSLGGVSFFVVFFFAFVAFILLFPEKADFIYQNKPVIGLLIGGTLAFAMGLADDAYNTKPLFKLFIQILCGVIIAFFGVTIDLTSSVSVNWLLTIFWVVALMNSLNMLDNMDGITGTVVTFILLSCLSIKLYFDGYQLDIWTILLIAQIGGLLGFLSQNIYPSKLFMGDAGSQFIAFYVAFFSIEYLWNGATKFYGASSINGMLICFVAFTPAFADTATVVINRLRRGQSPMVGGKDHTTHHLVYAGLNDRQVWYVFLAISAIAFVLSTFMFFAKSYHLYYPFIIGPLYTLSVFGVLYWLTRKFKKDHY